MIGRKLGSFRIKEQIDQTNLDLIFRAIDESTGEPATLRLAGRPDQLGSDRYRDEAVILERFSHPNLIRLLAWGQSEGISYLAFEPFDGVRMNAVLADRGRLPWTEVAGPLGLQICDALQYIHQMGVVHRNLKLANFLLNQAGQVKLVGFGQARHRKENLNLEIAGSVIGTPAYMAPEQIQGSMAVDARSDLYSLGVVVYQMLTGESLFRGTSPMDLMFQHINAKPISPRSRVPEIPEELDRLILRLLAKSPTDRPVDAAEVRGVFLEILGKDGFSK